MPLTRAQAREIDRRAMDELRIPGLILMENAARGIAEVADRLVAAPATVAIAVGPGNNGGDGLAAGRHLANLGHDVRFWMVVGPEAFRPGSDAALNLAIVRAMGLLFQPSLAGATLVLDAIFGTGLARPVETPFREAIEAVNAAGAPILAVDIPSGLDADTGEPLGAAVRATVTATMVGPKIGFSRGQGPAHVGRVEVVDIGVPPRLVADVSAG